MTRTTDTHTTGTRSCGRAVGPGGITGGLSVAGVVKSYGPVPVLHGVDLAVRAGTLTAVLGRSGCGKTTLLRLIAGFDHPDGGTITIDGHLVAGPDRALPPEDRRIGYVTQDGNLFPHLTVAANIGFGLPRRARRAGHRVAELLELVGLDDGFARRQPHELSGGQQQRVALARALAPKPGILLLDEPFSALDADLREGTRRAVAAALAAAGTTAVLVTHDQAEAMSLAECVAVMRDGQIVQRASPAQLYQHPVDREVAAFVGDIVALPATVRDGIARCALGELPVPTTTVSGPATVLLRPEQIILSQDRRSHDCADGVAGQVVAVDYFGHDALVTVRLAAGELVRARCPSYTVPMAGDAVRLSVRGAVNLERPPPAPG